MQDEMSKAYLVVFQRQYDEKSLSYPEVRENWFKVMRNFSDEVIQEAIDNLIKTNKFCPKPAELQAECKKLEDIEKNNKRLLTNQEYCYVCNNLGFVYYDTSEGKKSLYCTECEKGQKEKYDGRQCKIKSDYYNEPVTKYFDIEQLRSQNMFSKKESKIVPMPEEIKNMLYRINRKMGA